MGFVFSKSMLWHNHICLLIWAVLSGERCGQWASRLKCKGWVFKRRNTACYQEFSVVIKKRFYWIFFMKLMDMCDHSTCTMITLLCFDICSVWVPFLVSVEGRACTGRKHRWQWWSQDSLRSLQTVGKVTGVSRGQEPPRAVLDPGTAVLCGVWSGTIFWISHEDKNLWK